MENYFVIPSTAHNMSAALDALEDNVVLQEMVASSRHPGRKGAAEAQAVLDTMTKSLQAMRDRIVLVKAAARGASIKG
jgi:hypothetical protein